MAPSFDANQRTINFDWKGADNRGANDIIAPVEQCPNGTDYFPGQLETCFQINVTNNNFLDSYGNLTISDPTLKNLECTIDSVPLTASTTIGPYQGVTCYGAIPYDQTAPQHTNTATATGTNLTTGVTRTASDTLTMAAHVPSVKIYKEINGIDTTAAPGIFWEPNTEIPLTFEVVNTGDVELTNIVVDDSSIGQVCTIPSLAAGASYPCSAKLPGLPDGTFHQNTATVTATGQTPAGAETVTAQDTAWVYTASVPKVEVTKLVNDQEATTRPGVPIPEGQDWNFSVAVTNVGSTAIENGSVSDPQLAALNRYFSFAGYGDANWNNALDPGETWIYTTNVMGGFPVGYQHYDQATFTGVAFVNGTAVDVTGSAELHAESVAQNIQASLVKEIYGTVNGVAGWYDANTVPGVEIVPQNQCIPGDPADGVKKTCFKYTIKNEGNVQVSGLSLYDDKLTPQCPQGFGPMSLTSPIAYAAAAATGPYAPGDINFIMPGKTEECYGSLAYDATELQHINTATLTRAVNNQPIVMATDVANGYKDLPLPHSFTVETQIDGKNADTAADAATLAAGTVPPVTFIVANTGTAPITSFKVTDSMIDPAKITCDKTTLAQGEVATCTVAADALPAMQYGEQHYNLGTVTANFAVYKNFPDVTVAETLTDPAYAKVPATTATVTNSATVTNTATVTQTAGAAPTTVTVTTTMAGATATTTVTEPVSTPCPTHTVTVVVPPATTTETTTVSTGPGVEKPEGSSDSRWWWLLIIPALAGVIGLLIHYLPQIAPWVKLPGWLGVHNPPAPAPEPAPAVLPATTTRPPLTKGIPPQ